MLQAGANQRLRCQSWFDIPATELFAPAGLGRQDVLELPQLRRAGSRRSGSRSRPTRGSRCGASRRPSRCFSRQVNSPYNYAFCDNLPQSIFDLSAQIVVGNPAHTPSFGDLNYNIVAAGLVTTVHLGHLGLVEEPAALRAADDPAGHGQRLRDRVQARRRPAGHPRVHLPLLDPAQRLPQPGQVPDERARSRSG